VYNSKNFICAILPLDLDLIGVQLPLHVSWDNSLIISFWVLAISSRLKPEFCFFSGWFRGSAVAIHSVAVGRTPKRPFVRRALRLSYRRQGIEPIYLPTGLYGLAIGSTMRENSIPTC